jgi:hypothetical protein
MICDCCDRESRWARTSPDQVGWCSNCRTYQWRRDARLHAYLYKSKSEKGHGCVRCEEPWGEGLAFVWHPKCACGHKGPPTTHELMEVTRGKFPRARCSCGWTGTGGGYSTERAEEDLDEAFAAELAWEDARWAFDMHQMREEERQFCECGCHRLPVCIKVHADRQQQLPPPRGFACEHSA